MLAIAVALGCDAQARFDAAPPDGVSVSAAVSTEPSESSESSESSEPSEPVGPVTPSGAEPPARAEREREAEVDVGVTGGPAWRMPPEDTGPIPRWIRHRTLRGETIEQLAIRYGVRPESLRQWNELGEGDQPHPRRPKSLRVRARRVPPARQSLEHLVVEGDTWGSLARAHGVDNMHLRAWNVGQIGRTLEVGETVVVWVDPIVYDGIVHDLPADARAASVRPGAHGVGTPQAGVLVGGVAIPEGAGYRLKHPNSAFGTTWSVRHVVAALDHFVATSDYPLDIQLGTMSRPRGGELGGHNSHQTGRDLDIRLPLREGVPPGLPPINRRVDWSATWALVRAFVDTGVVEVVFLDYGCQRRLYTAAKAAGATDEELEALMQYPRGKKASAGLIKHAPGHADHLHVRFPCGPREPECG